MKLWHINDRGTRITGSAITPILKTDSMELGTGNMDLDSLMAQALAMDVDAVILESTATGWTIPPSRASSSVQNTLRKNSDLPFSHHFLLHYPHKSNTPHRFLLPVRGVVFCRESFCVTGCGCRLQGQASAIREGDFCGSVAGHGDGVGHGIACILPATFNAPHRGIVHCFCPAQCRVRGGGDGQGLPYQMDAAHATEQPPADGTVGVMVQGFGGVAVCVNARPCLPDGGSTCLTS